MCLHIFDWQNWAWFNFFAARPCTVFAGALSALLTGYIQMNETAAFFQAELKSVWGPKVIISVEQSKLTYIYFIILDEK